MSRIRLLALILVPLMMALYLINDFGTAFTISKTRLKNSERTQIEIKLLGITVPSRLGYYQSSFPQAATVSDRGMVQAVHTGSSTIKVRLGLTHRLFPVLVDATPGTPLSATNDVFSIQVWRRWSNAYRPYDDSSFDGTVFAVAIENISNLSWQKEKIKVDPKYFTLVDESGHTRPINQKAANHYIEPLVSTWIRPGNSASGIIVFTGEPVKKGQLIYDDGNYKPIIVTYDHSPPQEKNKTRSNLDVFRLYENSCGACHGHDGSGVIGPNLRATALSVEKVETVINEGIGSMPKFKGSELSTKQIGAIANYVKNNLK